MSEREGRVFLQWPASSDPQVSGYNVCMVGEHTETDFRKVNRAGPVAGTSLTLHGLRIGKTYYSFITTASGVEPAIKEKAFHETSAEAQPVP